LFIAYPENGEGALVPTAPIGHSRCGGLRADPPYLEMPFSGGVVSRNG